MEHQGTPVYIPSPPTIDLSLEYPDLFECTGHGAYGVGATREEAYSEWLGAIYRATVPDASAR